MTELFNIADVTHESPRLAWIKRHRVVTRHLSPEHAEGGAPWRAKATGRAPHQLGDRLHIGTGETEHDAIADLADLLGVPLWNEEEFAATTAKRESKNHETELHEYASPRRRMGR